MCGIVGYIGRKKSTNILIDGLKALEYRGYDSAGIANVEDGKIVVNKCVGRVQNLCDLIENNNINSCYGIAHTRWATHGKPTTLNSHPHLDNTETIAIVHNGIIENYSEIKKFLKDNGYTFKSETDTEVIPNLIHYYYTNSKCNNFLESFKEAINDLKGSFALCALCLDEPNKIFVTRKDSPLVIGTNTDENYIASDIPAILKYTKDFYLIDDNEFGVVEENKVEFYDKNLNSLKKEIKRIDWNVSDVGKAGYEDYMLKEIFEQPTAIRETIGSRLKLNEECSFEGIEISKEYLKSINKIYIVACGTAMHAGLVAKPIFEKLCNIPVFVDIASEFRYKNPLLDENTLCIYVSQSGETADTIAALKLAKEHKSKTLAISNVIGSSITRVADYSIYTHAGPEIAVASTKAFTSQVVILAILAIYFGEKLEIADINVIQNLKADILDLPLKAKDVLDNTNDIKKLADKIYKSHDVYYLGRGVDYSTALEASLKLKEISYIHSDAYAAGELKHGPIALIEEDINVIGILTNENLVEKSLSNFQEVISRGANVTIITNQDFVNKNNVNIIKIPNTNSFISSVLAIIPLQLLSYYISKNKGLDVDKPRNLAKSVTVE